MRAGLYKQLAELQALLSEFREDPENNAALKPAIADAVLRAGMQKDCPFRAPADARSNGNGAGDAFELTPDNADGVDAGEFEEYCGRLYGCDSPEFQVLCVDVLQGVNAKHEMYPDSSIAIFWTPVSFLY